MIKKVLVYHGKHDPEYFDASTKELEELSYRNLFKRLDSYGYYQNEYTNEALNRFNKDIEDALKNVNQLSTLEQTEDIKKLLETSKSKLKRYQRYKDIVTIELENYKKIKEDVDNVDVQIIRRFLYSRNNYEYEQFTFDNVT